MIFREMNSYPLQKFPSQGYPLQSYVAQRYNLGYEGQMSAQPAWEKPKEAFCSMPSRLIVIHTISRQLELYEENRLIQHYPIAVGKVATPTPHGRYTIATKTTYPGDIFGTRLLGLSIPHYGIHGTNNPSSIGQAVSKGCIRMHNDDVENLYQHVEIGTPVVIQC